MIKFLITHKISKRRIFGIVLTEKNIELLQESKPIHFNIEQLNMNKLVCEEILILYYKTNEEAEKDLREKGYITKDTKIQDIERSKPS